MIDKVIRIIISVMVFYGILVYQRGELSRLLKKFY